MNVFGAIVLIAIGAIIIFHVFNMKLETTDHYLAFYFMMIGVMDLYLNHIHNRFFDKN